MEKLFRLYSFLEKDLLNEILEKGVHKVFSEDETLIREGQFITSFPLVLKGIIRITRTNEQGNELLIYYLKENEVCAMSLTCCMANRKSRVNAVTEEETEVIMLPVTLLDSWICRYPSWKQFVMQTFQNRFTELMDTVDTLAFLKLDERLVKFFTERHKKSGSAIYTGTHQQLAEQLNTSREVVSRILKRLEKEGKIEISRNSVNFSGVL